MMDTKVVNDLTETNSQSCSFCGKSGKNLNDATNDLNETNAEKFSRGFSPLHCYIRTMELFLKVAYRLRMEKPTWRVAKSNEAVRQREATIRAEIKRRLGLRISEPLPSGGNSNDGNTSRTFFKEWRTICEITGLNEDLLERMYIILVIINCKSDINVEVFQNYLETTRKLYISLYGWYPLSPTLHKILVHGGAIAKHSTVPVGMLSEEALETRNKSIRKFREFHSRKFSRTANIEDVFQRLLLTSDPVISLMNRKSSDSPLNSLPAKAQELVILN
ncbi:uncharacterized protein LOC115256029 [Aedes albopictus]|uniref:Uncharacterized protein n=1 Tax=Aedes albopictus TaxID=7160 RepID=A0ABM1Z4H8_AEDAL